MDRKLSFLFFLTFSLFLFPSCAKEIKPMWVNKSPTGEYAVEFYATEKNTSMVAGSGSDVKGVAKVVRYLPEGKKIILYEFSVALLSSSPIIKWNEPHFVSFYLDKYTLDETKIKNPRPNKEY